MIRGAHAARRAVHASAPDATGPTLPDDFAAWFATRGWRPYPHQLALIAAAQRQESALLIAPTGGGKTLAGFLPSLIDLAGRADGERAELHTLYVSPLKALAVDVARNLAQPVAEMGLGVRVETRTGDTPPARRQRQRRLPPQILMTTPEQVALMLSHADSVRLFAGLKAIVLDELHALVTSKRGDLLALDLARLRRLAPQARCVGLSATVARPSELCAFLMPQDDPARVSRLAALIVAGGGAKPQIGILHAHERVPWAGHSALHALGDIYAAIRAHAMVLVFVNTRSQAELLFHELWAINDDNLPIALHHGSLDVAQRRKVEAAMAAGRLRAVVCTSTLDLGIDWGDVDLVINVGAPKGASRIAQRIGRANHRLDEPSKALLVPANRFEVMECQAALEAAAEGAQDTPAARRGALDVLAQHVLGMACAEPFDADALFDEVRSAAPYGWLTRETFDKVVAFVASGGYALRSYERYAKIRRTSQGRYRVANARVAHQYRLNVGTIVEAPMLKVRLARGAGPRAAPGPARPPRLGWRRGASGRPAPPLHASGAIAAPGGRILGEVEEWFIEQLVPGDTFIFAGEVLRFEGLRDMEALVTRAPGAAPKIPTYEGGKFPLSTYLADRVRRILASPQERRKLPAPVRDWLALQARKSLLPQASEVLVETFPRGRSHYLVCYPFEGRLAHQTLGMLLTRRLERLGARPLGFVANEYALAVWGSRDVGGMIASGGLDLEQLFDEDMLGDDLEAWLAQSNLMKRTFRICAVIAGLIERRHPGQEKSGRQVTVSSDLIYDVLSRHEPDHVLLQAAWADAATGLLDIARLGDFLKRIKGRIRHIALEQVSPLAVPVLLEIGMETIPGEAREDVLREASARLIEEAMGG